MVPTGSTSAVRGSMRASTPPIVAWSRSLTPAAAAALGVERAESPEAAVANADAVSVQLVQNIIFSGGHAACARISIVGELAGDTLARLGESPHVFAVSQVTL